MALLSADKVINMKKGEGLEQLYPAGVDIIYKGALVSINAAGFAVPATDTASESIAGIALEQVDNSGGSAGDEDVLVISGVTARMATAADLAQTTVGVDVTVLTDNEVSIAATTTNDILVGRCVKYVSATEVDVYIPPHGAGL